ncbi:MAG: DUF4389 domain-containing protein [Gammaproteobacteria bacterium]|nr:DUF4389 domain-containing protein [Pseudomonadota bacterium]MCZ6537143.1 DUF4389 domain-containing protein [Gammaproteobacteria bacterium]MCH8895563.1 DUF4389 domain-containing protein [Pseudomonadota bacterium]MCZ6686780.1 DUF4389 domain-containing protein [Gammaproteobacteria bacterium]MCZ6763060.1 DUF4389 domain-containing protein [Gammaproteobacteria bacterium]
MSDHEKSELEQHLTARNTWVRLVYMLLFGLIFWLGSIVLTLVVVLQFLHMLIAGKANDNLLQFGRQLGIYYRQLIDFLCYADEYQPFPFGAWPEAESGQNKATVKPSAQKKTAKKKAAKQGN